MADTVITNTPGTTRSMDDGSGAVAWVVGLIVVVAVIVGGIILYRNSGRTLPADNGTNIQVTIPSGTGGTGTGSTGGTGGTTQ